MIAKEWPQALESRIPQHQDGQYISWHALQDVFRGEPSVPGQAPSAPLQVDSSSGHGRFFPFAFPLSEDGNSQLVKLEHQPHSQTV